MKFKQFLVDIDTKTYITLVMGSIVAVAEMVGEISRSVRTVTVVTVFTFLLPSLEHKMMKVTNCIEMMFVEIPTKM